MEFIALSVKGSVSIDLLKMPNILEHNNRHLLVFSALSIQINNIIALI